MRKTDQDTVALARVETLLGLHRHDEAGRVISQVITSDPRNGHAWLLKAQSLLGQGRHEAALVAARAATSVAPEAEFPHRLASIALSHLGRREESVDAAEVAVRLAPDNWATHYLHGQTLLDIKALEAAQATAERAVALAPDRAEAHLGLGTVAAAQGRRGVAATSFRRALAINPHYTAAQTRLAALGTVRRGSRGLGRAPAERPRVTVPVSQPDGADRREPTVRRFISLLAYVICLIALLAIRLHGRGGSLLVLLVAVPVLGTAILLTGSAARRQHLLGMIRSGPPLKLAVALEAVAVAAILGGALSSGARGGLAAIAAASALVARWLIFLARGRTSRGPLGIRLRASS